MNCSLLRMIRRRKARLLAKQLLRWIILQYLKSHPPLMRKKSCPKSRKPCQWIKLPLSLRILKTFNSQTLLRSLNRKETWDTLPRRRTSQRILNLRQMMTPWSTRPLLKTVSLNPSSSLLQMMTIIMMLTSIRKIRPLDNHSPRGTLTTLRALPSCPKTGSVRCPNHRIRRP